MPKTSRKSEPEISRTSRFGQSSNKFCEGGASEIPIPVKYGINTILSFGQAVKSVCSLS